MDLMTKKFVDYPLICFTNDDFQYAFLYISRRDQIHIGYYDDIKKNYISYQMSHDITSQQIIEHIHDYVGKLLLHNKKLNITSNLFPCRHVEETIDSLEDLPKLDRLLKFINKIDGISSWSIKC